MLASRERFCSTRSGHDAVKVHAVGRILMAVGLAGRLLVLLWWERLGPAPPADPYDGPPPP